MFLTIICRHTHSTHAGTHTTHTPQPAIFIYLTNDQLDYRQTECTSSYAHAAHTHAAHTHAAHARAFFILSPIAQRLHVSRAMGDNIKKHYNGTCVRAHAHILLLLPTIFIYLTNDRLD